MQSDKGFCGSGISGKQFWNNYGITEITLEIDGKKKKNGRHKPVKLISLK